ncbi:glutathione peroxidase [Comamonas endophytica]|uniref:Glutathione peroxidase n=1 Tax=Comamonas endophytica TaxID=2949090 RepID=A0ABY6GGQ6_9BURK|nr:MULTISPECIES: glutathione peroxidase [unclassified Acidovorax]MCD2514308.1 glutathione peroxidase [Acidovorax sp. D4N7]UYG53557.1 glutathione peroxidase [Acidovorax sp. 5MLIR]
MQKFQSREGQPVPDVTFRYRENGEWKETNTEQLFKGKTVAVFSLPGAFTPTCSSTHLPRFNELAETFRANGVDDIICLAVNDPFVMESWGKDQGCDNVFLLPDGNGCFTEQMGMLVDKTELNFGKRSWRYSMLVRDGIIEKMFIEEQGADDDPFEVSDADTLLHYLNKDAQAPDLVAMLSREGCPFCHKAKQLLDDAGIAYADIPLPDSIRNRALGAIAKAQTVPQLFVNGKLIGDSEAIAQWVAERKAA